MYKFSNYKYFNFLFLTALMCIAAYISFKFFLPESLRLDESQSIWQANRSFLGLLEISARDVHMPLYNILLHNWIGVFGNNIFTNRILSLIFFLASIPMCFVITLLVTKQSRVGLYVATMFTFSPFMSWFGSELRMYSMLVFFTLCSHFIFLKILESKSLQSKVLSKFGQVYLWGCYFIFSLLGLYSHYFFVLFIFCQMVFYVFNQKLYTPIARNYFLSIMAILALGISPWILYVRYINSAGSQTPLLIKPSTVDLFNVYSNHFFGFQADGLNSLILSTWPLFGVFCLYLLQKSKSKRDINGQVGQNTNSNLTNFSTTIDSSKSKINSLFSGPYLYLAIMAFLPTAIIFFVSLTFRPVFLSRYLIMCLVPTFVLLASLLYSHKGLWLNLIKFGLLGLVGAGLAIQIMSPDVAVKENYREIINYVINTSSGDDVVAVSAPFTIYPFYYYYNGSAKLVTVPEWDLSSGIPPFTLENLDKQFEEFAVQKKRMYLVLSYDQGYEKKIKEAADTKFKFVSTKTFSPKLNLYVYDLK
jgi:mannosyltransferase